MVYLMQEIEKIIKTNNIFLTTINQLLHNKGIEFNSRMDIILDYIHYVIYNKKTHDQNSNNIIDKETHKSIISLIKNITIDTNEIYQIIFMFYGNKKTKLNLDQYYTPYTIGKFICSLIEPNKKIIDPASGTGDLVKNYNGDITLWDISSDVIEMCKYNYNIINKNCNVKCINSLTDNTKNVYDYCCLNPPFGSSTVINDPRILNEYTLGKNKKKQEIGILFIEKALQLVKNGGIVFIIIPNGYLGNSSKNTKELRKYLLNYRIISIVELPSNTFSRSGTGVSTSLMIIQKIHIQEKYNICIKKINNIGYMLNKKNTPYKYKMKNGKYILNSDDKPILDNDLDDFRKELLTFIKKENIYHFINEKYEKVMYEYVNIECLEGDILDINRYLYFYKNIIFEMKQKQSCKVKNFIEKQPKSSFKINKEMEYIYLDIRQITTPIYNKCNKLYGSELPNRAKIKVKQYDILVSKLKGKITFTIILDKCENIIASNGFCLLRPKNYHNALILFSNLFDEKFKIQHNSLCTGSIMETITEDDIQNIYIDENIDFKKYDDIVCALDKLNSLK